MNNTITNTNNARVAQPTVNNSHKISDKGHTQAISGTKSAINKNPDQLFQALEALYALIGELESPDYGHYDRDNDIHEHGTSGDDNLHGHGGDDQLYGHAGDDILKGNGGDDSLYGGKGDDILKGGRGDDVLKGGKGSDILKGGKGDDRLYGGKGDDILKGGKGDDVLKGGKGDDILKGGKGDDILSDNQGNNSINGGQGDDTLKLNGKRADYDIVQTNNGFTLTHKDSQQVNTVTNVESFKFSDGRVSAENLIDPLDVAYRSADGSGNNIGNPELGKAGNHYFRLLPYDSAREPGTDTEANLPSPRAISNAISAQSENTENEKGLSDMFWLWGQFLDHDVNLTHANSGDKANIAVPQGDQFFDPDNEGGEVIHFERSNSTTIDGHREQDNEITPFIDASNVYGSSQAKTDELRAWDGGKLNMSQGNLMPLVTEDGIDKGHFKAGDIRANEHGGLTSMHTLWMREHNRIATDLASENPDWGDEQLFQEARRQVGAEIQAITYNEYLPLLLGDKAPGEYEGYDKNTDPQISSAFATASYRFGHSMLSSTIPRLGEDGQPVEQGNLALRDAFFNPQHVKDTGIEPFLRGFATQTAQGLDTKVVDDVRNFLFGEPGQGGFDLASLNIQRGRDHGLPGYNDSRAALGLEPITSFDDPIFAHSIDSEGQTIGDRLKAVYNNKIDDIDLWVGGLAEAKSNESMLGETMTTINAEQFDRLREGDRFWYENQFSGAELDELNNLTLSDIIKRNSDVENIQDNVMISPEGNESTPSSNHQQTTAVSDPQQAPSFNDMFNLMMETMTTLRASMTNLTTNIRAIADAVSQGNL